MDDWEVVDLERELRRAYEEAGQGHVFDWWESLNATEKAHLLSQLQLVDPADLPRIREQAANLERDTKQGFKSLRPFSPVDRLADASAEQVERWRSIGLEAVRSGRVAALVLAGGQGTRLGCTFPKGCYDLALPSGKSLFQLQAEKIAALERLAAAPRGTIHWYVMTSDATDAPTRAFFAEHDNFGLDGAQLHFFKQGYLPAMTEDGKIILQSRSSLALSPDGNGGLYEALQRSGMLAHMEKAGVQHIAQYCVDNVLIKICDPVFVGWAEERDVDVACKVVPKRSAHESVGVLANRDGQNCVVEYSEIDKATAESVDESGTLVYNAAHLCINYYSTRFMRRCADEHRLAMRHHLARKKVPSVSASGETETPAANNGVKYELFIFDVFAFTERMACLEVARADEFAPLKNGEGAAADGPEHSRALYSALHKRLIVAAGGSLEGEGDAEVSPALSYDGENLRDVVGGRVFRLPLHLQ